MPITIHPLYTKFSTDSHNVEHNNRQSLFITQTDHPEAGYSVGLNLEVFDCKTFDHLSAVIILDHEDIDALCAQLQQVKRNTERSIYND